MQGASLRQANLSNLTCNSLDISDVNAVEANLSGLNVQDELKLRGAKLHHANLTNMSIEILYETDELMPDMGSRPLYGAQLDRQLADMLDLNQNQQPNALRPPTFIAQEQEQRNQQIDQRRQAFQRGLQQQLGDPVQPIQVQPSQQGLGNNGNFDPRLLGNDDDALARHQEKLQEMQEMAVQNQVAGQPNEPSQQQLNAIIQGRHGPLNQPDAQEDELHAQKNANEPINDELKSKQKQIFLTAALKQLEPNLANQDEVLLGAKEGTLQRAPSVKDIQPVTLEDEFAAVEDQDTAKAKKRKKRAKQRKKYMKAMKGHGSHRVGTNTFQMVDDYSKQIEQLKNEEKDLEQITDDGNTPRFNDNDEQFFDPNL